MSTNKKELTKYNIDDVIEASTQYFNGDKMAAEVWTKKYALKDSFGNIYEKTPDDMHWRIANEIARIDKKYSNSKDSKHYYNLLKDFKYVVPQGSPMAGIGNDFQIVSLSNCFVIGNKETADSYGAIMKIDEEQVQLMKRRGGCVEENTLVMIKGKGLIYIKDVEVGDLILSFNDKTKENEWKKITDLFISDVKLDEQIIIKYSNGTELRTSSKHPVTTLVDNEIIYKSYEEGLSESDIGYKPNLDNFGDLLDFDNSLSDIAWFLGCHTGDGSLNLNKYNKFRFRILGDNFEIIEKYKNVCNLLTESECNVNKVDRLEYNTDVWEYTQSSNKSKDVVYKYFDCLYGNKTYNGGVYEYIINNNLWLPYIAGLIDADGHIRENGNVELTLCMKNTIEKISNILSMYGIEYHVTLKNPKKSTHNIAYRLKITKSPSNIKFFEEMYKYIVHPVKKKRILDIIENNKYHSRKYFVTDFEFENIINNYNKYNNKNDNLISIIRYFKKDKKIGLGGLVEFLNHGILSESTFDEITSRLSIIDISYDNNEPLVYYDINVEDNHNYFAGNFGLVNIHNCGHDLSHIRPKGSHVKNSALTSTGVVPFMERYSNSTREVAQDGRRGALMLSINISHPDAEDFIDAKMNAGKVTGANISVKISDKFMKVVDRTTPEDLKRYDELKKIESKLKDDEVFEELQEFSELTKRIFYKQKFTFNDGTTTEQFIVAKKLWDKIIHNAWKSAEPGIMFWDQMQRESIGQCYEKFGFGNVSTNPCGELLLPPYDSCRLLVLNLYSYVKNPFSKDAEFDYELFKEHSHEAIRMMDNIVDLELEKIDSIIEKIKTDPESDEIKRTELTLWKKIRRMCNDGRRTGVGITAEGDMIAAMGYRYGTAEATKFAEKVHQIYAVEVLRGSVDLAQQRGSFPLWDWDLEKDNPYLNRLFKIAPEIKEKMLRVGRRNIALMTIAPTGSVSVCTQTTSGIEPAFMVFYTRRRKINPQEKDVTVDFVDEVGDSWTEYNVFHHKFIDWFFYNQRTLRSEIENTELFDIENKWTYDECKSYLETLDSDIVLKLVEKSPYYKAMANDVDWVEKVRMQGAIQKYIDHSISVTVNLPNDVDEDLVNDVYLTGWKSGCKGITIYRDGSRSGVLITKEEKTKKNVKKLFEENHAPKRPKRLSADVIHFMNKGEKWIAFVGLLQEKPYEIFTGPLDGFDITTTIEKGRIEKTKSNNVSKYEFQYFKDDEWVPVGDLKKKFDERFDDISKMTSAILRHGMPLEYVIELLGNLTLDGDLITTWKSGVKRVLKRYLKDGKQGKGQCPECGSENLKYQDGCLTCLECGHAACG